ncbi:MAG TPA: carbohydrate-binding family V/XII [Rubrivivax sp.]|nr:carbohydrate-binding family V/XII [Rubrivivax sp.]
MKLTHLAVVCGLVCLGVCNQALAQPAPAAAAAKAAAELPADAWPRDVSIANAAVLMYQPQVNSWVGNRIDFRAALAIKPGGAAQETFGVVFATARTQVDKAARTVVFENLQLAKIDFPTLPGRGAGYMSALQAGLAQQLRTMSLDRLEASLAASGAKHAPVQVRNDPPQVVVSNSPAILVPINGAPVWKPVPGDSRFQRVINTSALILKGGLSERLYMHVYDGWLSADAIEGPWTLSDVQPLGMADAARKLAQGGQVDLLDGGPKADPKPTLAGRVPTIVVSQQPTELIVFKGQPDFVPISGTQLLWAANTTADVFIDTGSNNYYVLMAGRWFSAPALNGPWSFVAANALPADFARIPPASQAAAVLPTVAGTPQAQEALISNSIPQTATVPLQGGPKFTPSFDGPPQYSPIPGTPLSYVVNSSVPLIRADAGYYAVTAGVWFTAAELTGPWRVATSVPAAIYAIPASSPLHYVTYVRIYDATPSAVYVGYTPGYLGTVVSPYGTVVYGTGYVYDPWIGSVWYAPPYTYGVAAAPVYNPYVGFTYGFAVGLATAAWMEPYWGGAYYHPYYWGGYGCCATASANVYGHWGNTAYSGTRSWYGGGGVAGSTASGTYRNARTGTTGSYSGGRQYNAWTGNATRGYDRTADGAAGGSGSVARAGNFNTYTGQRSTANSASVTGPGGSSFDRSGATTAGPQGDAHAGGGSTTNAHTGKTNTWDTATVNGNHYADVNGNVYRNTGGGWQQHSSGGWGAASGDTSWAQRESQARRSGGDRADGFNGFGGGGRFGGGDRFGGGGGRFGGGGFGGGGFGGRFGGGFRR